MAQLERDIIAERVKAGLRRARTNGQKLGRPKVQVDLERFKALRSAGYSTRQIARDLGVSKGTVTNLAKALS